MNTVHRRDGFHGGRSALLAALGLCACIIGDRQIGELASTSGDDSSSLDGDGHEGPGEATSADTSTGAPYDIPCVPDDMHPCRADLDRDNVGIECDNAPEQTNPDQTDLDGDGIGDVVDLCVTVASTNNTADSDEDGIGNDCDSCRQTPSQYNGSAFSAGVPFVMQVRNIPDVGDVDGDGIGDACDNCVVTPNCEDYGPQDAWAPGRPIAYDDANLCQRDDDANMIGDACEGLQTEGAAGVVGFGHADDFDQDGLANAIDGCVRLPLELELRVPCTNDGPCPDGSHCELSAGICNHIDSDGDTVGDRCDTCASAPNGDQLVEGGSVEDDSDGDFVGSACETIGGDVYPDPAPTGFYADNAQGLCCTVALVEQDGALVVANTGLELRDPDGVPVHAECSATDEAAHACRTLPQSVRETPGMLVLPAGCAGPTAALGPADVGNDEAAFWALRCEFPQRDQDFDGIADGVDLCPFAFDPENLPYIDEQGTVWPEDGKYCNGAYSADALCGA